MEHFCWVLGFPWLSIPPKNTPRRPVFWRFLVCFCWPLWWRQNKHIVTLRFLHEEMDLQKRAPSVVAPGNDFPSTTKIIVTGCHWDPPPKNETTVNLYNIQLRISCNTQVVIFFLGIFESYTNYRQDPMYTVWRDATHLRTPPRGTTEPT